MIGPGGELLSFLQEEIPKINTTDLLGISDAEINPDITVFRGNISKQVNLIIDSFHELLVCGYADTMNYTAGLKQFPIYRNGYWEVTYLKCMIFRTSSYFMINYFIEGGFGDKLLDFMKQHSGMYLRKNVRMIYDPSYGVIYIDKFEEYTPPEPTPADLSWERAKLITNPTELY